MFLKPIEVDVFIYYGIFVGQGEVDHVLKRNQQKGNMYEFIYGQSLEYMRVGDSKKSKEYVIGKQIDLCRNFSAIRMHYDMNGKLTMAHMNRTKIEPKLSKETEMGIKEKLFKIGFLVEPDYYLFHSYTVNRKGAV